MYYEVWDVVTRNLLYDFDTRDEALGVVRELVDANPEPGLVSLALARVDQHHQTTWIAEGDALLEMSLQHGPRQSVLGEDRAAS